MEVAFPLLFAGIVGFGHAFEADHLVAVGNIVTKRKGLHLALKDGVFWGLGHASTIFLIGLLMIVGKSTFLDGYFGYLEGVVGLMLIILGVYRLYQYFNEKGQSPHTINHNPHSHVSSVGTVENHRLAYGVGLIHGLAGSGAMILIVMAEMQSAVSGMLYLLIFGIGSVVGMFVAAGIFSLPFSKKISQSNEIYFGLILLSSLLCIGLGAIVMFENFT